jgi:hypothetical protein
MATVSWILSEAICETHQLLSSCFWLVSPRGFSVNDAFAREFQYPYCTVRVALSCCNTPYVVLSSSSAANSPIDPMKHHCISIYHIHSNTQKGPSQSIHVHSLQSIQQARINRRLLCECLSLPFQNVHHHYHHHTPDASIILDEIVSTENPL